jgi:hypothetical protein
MGVLQIIKMKSYIGTMQFLNISGFIYWFFLSLFTALHIPYGTYSFDFNAKFHICINIDSTSFFFIREVVYIVFKVCNPLSFKQTVHELNHNKLVQ